MRSQWECLLENLGCWQGSFARLSPQGDLLEDIPSETILEGRDRNHTVHQVVRRYVNGQPQELTVDYTNLGRHLVFFENGAFSQGSMQLGFHTEFGAEFGLLDRSGQRRLRLVQLFDRTGNLANLTLIREKLPESNTPERPPLTLDALLGKWQGEAVTLYPDARSPETYATTTIWERRDELAIMTLHSGTMDPMTTIAQIAGNALRFKQNALPVQTLFLPDGASSTCPLQVKLNHPIRLAVSWLRDDVHERLLRSYSDRGEWTSTTLVTERRIG